MVVPGARVAAVAESKARGGSPCANNAIVIAVTAANAKNEAMRLDLVERVIENFP